MAMGWGVSGSTIKLTPWLNCDTIEKVSGRCIILFFPMGFFSGRAQRRTRIRRDHPFRSHFSAVPRSRIFSSLRQKLSLSVQMCVTWGLTPRRHPGPFLDFSKQRTLCIFSYMALKIRLTRVGATHKPYYRVVVAEARSRRDGAATEVLGTYQPTNKARADQCKLDLARVDYWISKGATPTDTAWALIKRAKKAAPAAEAAPAAVPATA